MSISSDFLFFFVSVFFSSFSYRRFILFYFFLSQASYLSHNRLFFYIFFNVFYYFSSIETFLVFLVYVLDQTGSLPVSFSVQIIYCIVS